MVNKLSFGCLVAVMTLGGCIDFDQENSSAETSKDSTTGSAYIPAHYSFSVSSKGTTACTPSTTLAARNYDITVLGTIYYGKSEGRMMDAGYFLNEARYNYQPYAIKSGDGDGGLRMAGSLLPVGDYRSDHVYEFTKKGTGAEFCFRMHDEFYDDNSGEFTIKVDG